MADLTFTNKATIRRASPGIVAGKGDANSLKMLASGTVELAPSASGVTVTFGRIPSNARLSGFSRIYWDDLTTTGSPTIDLGLGSVNANVTNDPDALSNGHDVTSADAGGEPAIDEIANLGLPAWDFVASVTTDPGGELEVYASVKDAATAGLTATLTVEIYGYLD